MAPGLELDATDLVIAYRARQMSPVECLANAVAAVESVGNALNATVADCFERAQAEARCAERAYMRNRQPRPLEGVPFVAKDLLDTQGVATGYGSCMFASNVPAVDAEVVARVRAAGGILLAKTATDEFAHGITGTGTQAGPVRNPWSPDRVSGGSSAGSAAVVGAGVIPLALGSDTGGSIRVPAAFCGIVGLKPTFGAVPTTGLFPMAPSLDHVGVMTGTPRDAALLLRVVGDRYHTGVRPHAAPLRVGVSSDLSVGGVDIDVARVVEAAAGALAGEGRAPIEIPIAFSERIFPVFQVTQRAEAAATHRRLGLFPARAAEYRAHVRKRLELGAGVFLDDYLEAQLERDRLRRQLMRIFDEVDVLVTPVAGMSPVEIAVSDAEGAMRERVMPFTTLHNLFGLPSCAVRAGFDGSGMPVGVQIAAAPGHDQLVLRAAADLYAATPAVQERRPPVIPGLGR